MLVHQVTPGGDQAMACLDRFSKFLCYSKISPYISVMIARNITEIFNCWLLVNELVIEE